MSEDSTQGTVLSSSRVGPRDQTQVAQVFRHGERLHSLKHDMNEDTASLLQMVMNTIEHQTVPDAITHFQRRNGDQDEISTYQSQAREGQASCSKGPGA